jgi:hypothetical protein
MLNPVIVILNLIQDLRGRLISASQRSRNKFGMTKGNEIASLLSVARNDKKEENLLILAKPAIFFLNKIF